MSRVPASAPSRRGTPARGRVPLVEHPGVAEGTRRTVVKVPLRQDRKDRHAQLTRRTSPEQIRAATRAMDDHGDRGELAQGSQHELAVRPVAVATHEDPQAARSGFSSKARVRHRREPRGLREEGTARCARVAFTTSRKEEGAVEGLSLMDHFPTLRALLTTASMAYETSSPEDFEDEEAHLSELSTRKYLRRSDLRWIVNWKTGSRFGKWVVQHHREERLRKITRAAFAESDPGRAIDLLVNSGHGSGLWGVSYPIASAILTFHDQRRFTILDWRAWGTLHALGALPTDVPDEYSAAHYVTYLQVCKGMSREMHMSLRKLDRALYTIGGSLWVLTFAREVRD